MKYVLLYESGAIDRERIIQLAPEHRARCAEFFEIGTLLMVGPFTDPAAGAMGIFTTAEAAEEFARADPFVTGGVVAGWRILEWNA